MITAEEIKFEHDYQFLRRMVLRGDVPVYAARNWVREQGKTVIQAVERERRELIARRLKRSYRKDGMEKAFDSALEEDEE